MTYKFLKYLAFSIPIGTASLSVWAAHPTDFKIDSNLILKPQSNALTVLPDARLRFHPAFFEGQVVFYITTDISDLQMAQKEGVNYAPVLADIIKGTPKALAAVYKFKDGSQPSIFPVAPGAFTSDPQNAAGYTPLWRVVEVRKINPNIGILKSHEELLAAEERGDVELSDKPIVVNCPVVLPPVK